MTRFRKFLITTVIGGVVVLLPIVILVWVVSLVLRFVESLIDPISQMMDFKLPDLVADIIIIAGIVAFCFVVGLIVQTRFGRSALLYIEREYLEKVPAYSTIRDIIQQFSGTKKAPFKQVVSVDVFGTGTEMTGFITDSEGDIYTVFVPTAPNPTNGFVFHVHASQLKFVGARTEDAMRTIVGMGVGSIEVLNTKPVRLKKQVEQSPLTDDKESQSG
jgi:uncharacterized membrane protein